MMNNDKDQMHPEDTRNLVIFVIAAVVIWFLYDHFLLKPKVQELRAAQERQRAAQKESLNDIDMPSVTELQSREAIISDSPRIEVTNNHIFGSIALVGGRIDDVSLRDYFKTLRKRENVNLFSPMGSYHPRYAGFGWISSVKGQKTPDKNTRWQVAGGEADAVLSPGNPVTLYWENGTGLRFEQIMEVDDQFLFTVTQRVINRTGQGMTLYSYAVMAQHGLPEDLYGRWIIHEGPIGYIGDELVEVSYKNIVDEKLWEKKADEGWLALTERYWFTGLFPETGEAAKYRFLYVDPAEAGHIQPRYQIDVMSMGKTLPPQGTLASTTHVYVGPKKLDVLENYEGKMGWHHIDLAIDFGMYYFLTKPLFYLLHWLGDVSGNFGIGIILLTLVVRVFVFPLANTSYRSFAGLRKISPKMHAIREKYGDDKEKLQAALVKLYEKEKVNPMAGCLPILIQIPIFFALFKVLQVSVEMRHAPFYGWINDLSAPDPTSVFNLFGLIPWTPPEVMMIGAWPCMMLFFMILQKKMSPPPQDKMQKAMMDFMPFFITYILSGFAAGLVIYWTFSNALSVIQQYIIMKSMGVEPHLFKTKEQKEMEKEIAEGPAVHPELEVIEHDVEDALFGEEEEDGNEEKPAKKKAAKKKGSSSKNVTKPKPKKAKKKKG